MVVFVLIVVIGVVGNLAAAIVYFFAVAVVEIVFAVIADYITHCINRPLV